MNIRPVDRDFFRFVSRIGNRKLVIEIDLHALTMVGRIQIKET